MIEEEDFELVHGSGNIYRDFGDPEADVKQAKVILAAEIIRILDEQGLSTRKAQELTGINYADFARIRRPNLDRFTIDRLISILNKLNYEVQITVSAKPNHEIKKSVVLNS